MKDSIGQLVLRCLNHVLRRPVPVVKTTFGPCLAYSEAQPAMALQYLAAFRQPV